MTTAAARREKLGIEAYKAIVNQSAGGLKKLISHGLDINGIDLSGTPDSVRSYFGSQNVSALPLLFHVRESLSRNRRKELTFPNPKFVRELAKMGCSFDKKLLVNEGNSAVLLSPLEIFVKGFISTEIQVSKQWSKYYARCSEVLDVFIDFGCEADKVYSLDYINWELVSEKEDSVFYSPWRPFVMQLRVFGKLYKLELAAGVDVYNDGTYEQNPFWLNCYFKLNQDNINEISVKIPQRKRNGVLSLKKKNYTQEEDKKLFRKYLGHREITTITHDVFNKVLHRMLMSIDDAKTDEEAIGPGSYLMLLNELLSRRWYDIPAEDRNKNVELICRESYREFNIRRIESIALCSLLERLLNFPGVLKDLTKPKERRWTTGDFGVSPEFYTPVVFDKLLLSCICEKCLQEGINLNDVFYLALHDLARMTVRVDNFSYYDENDNNDKFIEAFDKNLFESETRIDILQCYGWNINSKDSDGNTPLHHIFRKNCLGYSSDFQLWKPCVKKLLKLFESKGCDFTIKIMTARRPRICW